MRGRTTCYYHGGVTKTMGPANINFTEGRYSKVLPLRLAQTYQAARTNPALLSLRDDLAACEARLADLFQRVDTGESGALWKTLGSTLDAFNAASSGNDLVAMRQHLVAMRTLISQGSDDYAAWGEIQSLWDTRCKLTLTEQKTLVAMQQMISAEQLMLYFGVITAAIHRIVPVHTDPESARAILGDLSAEFQRISLLESHIAS